ncbi:MULTISPECIES: RrF2 family transcriptional regulator [Caproicibacterium]|uniref:Rrf2 family transcriptional regulator n=1 Tax=Caproicibacterium argilliputei TaxID=3030016 RepID=A0AA97H201_9FIRM|nr:Rrf2 family transcriptional regulator [Caproicibacterium argilliputei]WOC32983.1 Rrf2 family transcriptional regulator [Caproicibacterium argilliputei]
MRISAKGRYAIAALLRMAQSGKDTVVNITRLSEGLGISRIYLEQVFSLLKRAQLVISTQGAQGGYRLAQQPAQIRVLDILRATDTALFEHPAQTLANDARDAQAALDLVENRLEESVEQALSALRLSDLLEEAARSGENYMFFI